MSGRKMGRSDPIRRKRDLIRHREQDHISLTRGPGQRTSKTFRQPKYIKHENTAKNTQDVIFETVV